jgi:iron complex outermembrane receptor protein
MRRATWRWASMLVWGWLALCGEAAAATGEARLYAFNVPPGPLHEAIDQLAASAHLQVLYDPAVASGRLTRGVKGSMTLAEAFERLLAATNVTYQFTAADTVALYREQSTAVVATPPPMALIQPVAPPQPLPVVQVSAQRSGGANAVAGTSLTAMKTDASVLATPTAFESVTQPMLEDRQADRIEDVLEGVSGIEIAPDGQDTVGFVIRGIPAYQYYVDGVRVSPDLHHDAFRDLADVASIDVVKGPASTLYGRTEPGGLINIVTKQPLSEPYFSAEQQVGSFDHRRTQLDTGGPLNDTGTLLSRFNAAWETAQSYRRDCGNRRIFLAPVVTWSPSPQSAVTGYLEYLRSDDPTDSGLPIVGASIPAVPVGRRVEDGGKVHTRDLHTGIRGWQVLNDRWTVRYHFDGRWLRTPQSPQLALADDGLDPAACSRGACPVDQLLFSIPVSRGQTYFTSAELLGDLDFWGARHAILFGSEFFDVHGDSVTLYNGDAFTTDLYSPRRVRVPGYLLQSPDGAYATWTSERWSGVYLQDQVGIGQRVYVLLGVRYDHAREWLDIASGFPLQDDGKDMRWDHAFKRHAGIVWRATEPLSLYANYAENFGISTGIYGDGTGGTGTLVPPEMAHEWEVGAKAAFLDGRLKGSLAWFDLTELNISLPGFAGVENSGGVRVVTGTERSRGAELDLRGEIFPDVQLLASYAFLDTRILADVGAAYDFVDGTIITTRGNTGNRLFGTPRHGGSAWVSYRPGGMLQGLKLGLGTVARTWREGDNENDYRLPGFAKWGALAGYEWPWGGGRLALQLNVDNLFNTRYFESISGTHTIMPAAPRRWLASVYWSSGPRR